MNVSDKAEKTTCFECGASINPGQFCVVDEKPICIRCLCGDADPFVIWPIGSVRNDWKTSSDVPRDVSDSVSEIHLAPGQKRFMLALEFEERVMIVWGLHGSNEIWTAFHRRLDGREVGPFAARTPHRQSRIAVTTAELIGIRDTILVVKGLDAMDGSPVFDVKIG